MKRQNFINCKMMKTTGSKPQWIIWDFSHYCHCHYHCCYHCYHHHHHQVSFEIRNVEINNLVSDSQFAVTPLLSTFPTSFYQCYWWINGLNKLVSDWYHTKTRNIFFDLLKSSNAIGWYRAHKIASTALLFSLIDWRLDLERERERERDCLLQLSLNGQTISYNAVQGQSSWHDQNLNHSNFQH